jgi:hypothetical protein
MFSQTGLPGALGHEETNARGSGKRRSVVVVENSHRVGFAFKGTRKQRVYNDIHVANNRHPSFCFPHAINVTDDNSQSPAILPTDHCTSPKFGK